MYADYVHVYETWSWVAVKYRLATSFPPLLGANYSNSFGKIIFLIYTKWKMAVAPAMQQLPQQGVKLHIINLTQCFFFFFSKCLANVNLTQLN